MSEVGISVKGLLFYVLEHWKSVLVGAIIGSFLLGAFCVYESSSPNEDVVSNNQIDSKSEYGLTLAYCIETTDSDTMNFIVGSYYTFLQSEEFYNFVESKTTLMSSDIKDNIEISRTPVNEGDIISGFFVDICFTTEKDTLLAAEAIADYVTLKDKQLEQFGLEYMISQFDGLNIEQIDQSKQSPESDAAIVRYTTENILKKIILGFIIGCVVVVVFHTAVYALGDKLDEEDDVENIFGVYHYGIIPGKMYGKAIYKLRNFGKRTFNAEESSRLIAMKIKCSIEDSSVNSLGLVGCEMEKYSAKEVALLAEHLKGLGIDTIIVDNPLYSSQSLETLQGIGQVILFEKVGETIRSEVRCEIEMLNKLGVHISGMVLTD